MITHHSCFASKILVVLGVVVLGLVGAVLRSEEQPGNAEEIGALIQQLGAAEYAGRAAATRRLWELGEAALPALREACRSEEPEISIRARKITADLELGILVDTPPETIALIREFHSGGLEQKEVVLRRLRGADQVLTRLRLLLSEKNPEWRTKLVREFAGTGDVILDALRESGNLEEAEKLLAIISPRSWAVHLLFEGKAEATVATLTAEWDQGKGSAEPSQLFWLLVVTDKLAEARAVAEQSGETGLRREICLRQGDWRALAEVEVEGAEVGDNPVEKLSFKAWFLAKAGDEAGAKAAIDELAGLEIEDDRMARNRSASLIILGHFDLAEKSFVQLGELDGAEFSFHLERFQFDTLARRLGVDPTGNAAAEEMKKRIEKALEEDGGNDGRNDRRELFNLSRSVGELLASVGEKAEAKEVFLATLELARKEPSYQLSYLASTCRKAGLVEEALSIELEALAAGGRSLFLSGRFPEDRAVAQFWWDFLRSQNFEEPVGETLQRVADILEAADGEGAEDVAGLVEEALKWVEKQNEDARVKHYGAIAAHYRRLQQWEDATAYYRKQSKLMKTPASPLLEAGKMFANEGRWKEAAAFHAEAAKVEPGNELAAYLHGHALVQGGEQEKGDARKAAALRMPLANSSRRNTFAFGLLRHGLAEAAEEQWRFILKTAAHDDWDGSAYWTLRTARSRLVTSTAKENPALAADLLEGYLVSFVKTNTSSTTRNYLIHRARIETLRFEACIAEGKVEEAVTHVHRALAARPGSTNLVIDAMEQLTVAGREEIADELYESLVKRYAVNLARFPKGAQFHNSLAWLAGRSGRDLALALPHAETAVTLRPDHPEYLDTLAEVHFRLGNREKALALAKRCVELDPDAGQYQDQLKRFASKDGESTDP